MRDTKNATRGSRRWLRRIAFALALVAMTGLLYRTELTRLWNANRVFEPGLIAHNFQHMETIFDARRVEHGDDVLEFARGSYSLPESFRFDGRVYDTEAFLADLVTSRSFVSALFGIAVDDGQIPDIMAPVTDYLPELEGSPEAWVRASVTPDAPHLMPGPKPDSIENMGYGYQWWIPEEPEGDFMALGIYGQMIYVNPGSRLVIAKNGVDLDFQRNNFESDRTAVALFRKIAKEVSR